ncbi:tRNA pseudouridine(13) synthase TruD [Haloplanus litoreus]|uniref:tRNA pseudouridine(13) synthase TruD n=1 Tax=Haloplanus litoreus TaxID=767515 RepID=UPI00361ED3CD
MREAHPLERQVGIDYYVSDGPGVGGRLRATPAAFRVRELEAVDPEPLDADQERTPTYSSERRSPTGTPTTSRGRSRMPSE